jgi:hypothetical protein
MRLSLTPSTPPRPPDHWGETIETSSTEYTAQCFAPDDLRFPTMPPLGSWVRAADGETEIEIYGVVYHTTTLPIDTIHRARPLGLSLQQIQEQQPQIFAMLRTEFRVAIVGFTTDVGRRRNAPPYQYLPPRPPQIHQGVFRCSADEIANFCQGYEFLRTLLRVQGAPTDELVAAVLRQGAIAAEQVGHSSATRRQWLLQAGRSLALLLRDDYDRLRAILSKIQLS